MNIGVDKVVSPGAQGGCNPLLNMVLLGLAEKLGERLLVLRPGVGYPGLLGLGVIDGRFDPAAFDPFLKRVLRTASWFYYSVEPRNSAEAAEIYRLALDLAAVPEPPDWYCRQCRVESFSTLQIGPDETRPDLCNAWRLAWQHARLNAIEWELGA